MTDQSTRTAAAAERMAAAIRKAGWERFIVNRRAPEAFAHALAAAGLASSITHRPGEADWRLSLSATGRAVREVLSR